MDLMLDIETLGTRPGCVVLTLGAVKFNPHNSTQYGETLYIRPSIDEQTAMDREIQEDTAAWWETQATDVKEEALSNDNRISLSQTVQQLNKFCVGVNQMWAQGPAFDFVILENLYRSLGEPTPWNFWQIRDSRTLFGALGDPRIKGKAGLHNALEDSISQAQGVQQVFEKINRSGLGNANRS